MSKQAEAALLGSMVISDTARIYGLSRLGLSDFTTIRHEEVFRALGRAGASDIVAVRAKLDPAIHYEELADLVTEAPNAENYRVYCNLILEARAKVQARELSMALREQSMNGASLDDLKETTNRLGEVLRGATEERVDYAEQSLNRMRQMMVSGVDVSWGIKRLDDLFGGVRRGYMYVLGAKTGQLKTTNVIRLVRSNPTKRFILNVTEVPDQMFMRLAAQEHGLPLSHFTKPHLFTGEQQQVALKAQQDTIDTWRGRMIVMANASLAEMEEVIIAERPDVIVLDYIQRFAGKYGQGGSRHHDIGNILGAFQDLAIRHDAAAVVTSQFSRRQEDMEKRRPRMADLKESGDIEAFSNGVILAYWPFKDGDKKQEESNYYLLVVKNTVGPEAEIELRFNPETVNIEERAEE